MAPILWSLALYLVLVIGLRHLRPSGILFYQGVAVAVAVAAGLLVYLRMHAGETWLAAGKDALLVFSIAYAFVFTVPTTVDRAYSVRMLLQLAQAPAGLSKADIIANYAHDFMAGGGAEKRLQEQVTTGSLREAGNGNFVLTGMGRFLALSFRFIAKLFACSVS